MHRARFAELSFDTITAALSLSDIGLDLAVAYEFHAAGRTTFFHLSIAIFLVAQACYAFLFVATYGDHLNNCGKTSAFFAACVRRSRFCSVRAVGAFLFST